MPINGIELERDLPQSIVIDNPEGRFSEGASLIMNRKYLIKGPDLRPVETPKERIIRIAQTMAEPERQFGGDEAYKNWLEMFYHAITSQDFSPGGRIWSNAGTSIQQLFNCFVFPQFPDVRGIMKTLTDTALTHKEGGGTGFNFSVIPPKGVEYNGMISPGSVVTIDNTDVETETICQGNRRGANMGVVNYNDPDVVEFVFAKRDRREVRNREVLEDRLVEAVTTSFDRMKLDYDQNSVRKSVSEILDINLEKTTYARKIGVTAEIPKGLEETLVDGKFYPVINPVTGEQFTQEELEMYGQNVESNKAALGADSVVPLAVVSGDIVESRYTGNPVGVVREGNVFMDYKAVKKELEDRGVAVRGEPAEGETYVEDDLRAIFETIGDSAVKHSQGEATTLNFSGLRPKGSPVRGGAAISSGLRSFMRNYDTEARMYHQTGELRLNEAVVSIDHPDLLDVASLLQTYWRMDRPKALVDGVTEYMRAKAVRKYGKAILTRLEGLERVFIRTIRGLPQEVSRENHKLKNFNISVLVDQGFVDALNQKGYFSLIHDGREFTADALRIAIANSEKAKAWLGSDAQHSLRLEGDDVYETYGNRNIGRVQNGIVQLHAPTFFNMIVENAHATADPGLLLGFNANKDSQIEGKLYDATNPCGEIWLYHYEPCDLGSLNAKRMTKIGEDEKPKLDERKVHRSAYVGQRFLDNVHDANRGPIPEIEVSARGNRRTGLGIMGWANLLADLWIPYDSEEALEVAGQFARVMNEGSLEASIELAREKGAFPNFERSIYRNGEPRRNVARMAIAPTGTISMLYDVNSSVEPFFALAYKKLMRGGDYIDYLVGEFEKAAHEWGFHREGLIADVKANHGSVQGMNDVPEEVRRVFVTSHDIAPEWHVRTQAVFQGYFDNAVSKTINMPNSATVQDVDRAYRAAMTSGLKGITVYRDGSRDEQILVA